MAFVAQLNIFLTTQFLSSMRMVNLLESLAKQRLSDLAKTSMLAVT
jgi:hypothetical protein